MHKSSENPSTPEPRKHVVTAARVVLLATFLSLILVFQNCSQPLAASSTDTLASSTNLYAGASPSSTPLTFSSPAATATPYSGLVQDGQCVSNPSVENMAILPVGGVAPQSGSLVAFTRSDGSAALWNVNSLYQINAGIVCKINEPGWSLAAVGDFNGDSDPDILWHNTDGRNIVWLMHGLTRIQTGLIASSSSTLKLQATADVDGSGTTDLIWRSTADGSVSVWLMNGVTATVSTSSMPIATNWSLQGVGDFNNDGKTDLLWRDTSTGAMQVWYMNGAANTVASIPVAPNTSWTLIGVGDIDEAYAAHYADLVFYNPSTLQIFAWSLNGITPSTAGQAYIPTTSGWTPIGLNDIDQDGKMELLWTSSNNELAAWTLSGIPAVYAYYLHPIQTGWTPFKFNR